MTTAIALLLKLCKPGEPPAMVPRWLWDRAMDDFFRAPPSHDLDMAFLSITYTMPVLAAEAA